MSSRVDSSGALSDCAGKPAARSRWGAALETVGLSRNRNRPGADELERDKLANTREVALIVRHQDVSSFPTRERQQNVIAECLRHSTYLEAVLSRHLGQQITRLVPSLH